MRDLIIAFLLGALVAAGGAFWYEAKQREQFAQALKLLRSGEEATAYTRAMSAYRDEDPKIAIWELTHLVAIEKENLNLGLETNGELAGLMLTHARLARLYHQEGREAEAQTNADEAMVLMGKLHKPDPAITNMATLLVRLRDFDDGEKQKRRHE